MTTPLIEFDFGRPGLIWGVDADGGHAESTENVSYLVENGVRWLHLNLAVEWTRDWIASCEILPGDLRDMLLSPDDDQRAVVDKNCVGFVLHDFEREFDARVEAQIGVLRFAVTPRLLITTRRHPLRSADLAHARVKAGAEICDIGDALGILLDAVADVVESQIDEVAVMVLKEEDDFLAGRASPAQRDQLKLRRRVARLHRLLDGMRNIFHRLERDRRIDRLVAPVVERTAQRLDGLDGEATGLLAQLKQLRDELDLQAAQRTNQNLYVLSIMTALMLPATLVTGLFGMNTGGLPFAETGVGTAMAALLALGASGLTYALLIASGLLRR